MALFRKARDPSISISDKILTQKGGSGPRGLESWNSGEMDVLAARNQGSSTSRHLASPFGIGQL